THAISVKLPCRTSKAIFCDRVSQAVSRDASRRHGGRRHSLSLSGPAVISEPGGGTHTTHTHTNHTHPQTHTYTHQHLCVNGKSYSANEKIPPCSISCARQPCASY